MRKLSWLCLSLCLLAVAAVAAAGPGLRRPQNVILIGWDGAQRNHVKECLSRGELPALKRLSDEGTLVAIDVLRTTDTKSGWAQILTGYEPEVTGVFSNGRFQPIPRGYTVFERLEEFFGPDEFATMAVIGKTGHVGAESPKKIPLPEQNSKRAARLADKVKKLPGGLAVTEDGKKYLVVPGEPYYLTKQGMDVFLNGLGENGNVGAKALALLEQYKDKPFFFFVHFADVDHKGHQFGENSKEYNDALISSDTWTGKIVEKLKELKLYDKTLVYVTADHGFDEDAKGHGDAPYVFLATNDPRVRYRGTRVDITPTILDRFGLDLRKLQPPLDGHPLTESYNLPLW